jgi:hypothetical protein
LGASSVRNASVSAQAAAFTAEYAPEVGTCAHASTDNTFRTAPPPFFSMIGTNSLLTFSVPK